jgi:hypothetical protein
MFKKICDIIQGTKLGQAYDNLIKQTSGDGFKSKCVVASYLSVARVVLLVLLYCLAMLIIYAIGTFSGVPVAGDIMIEMLKIVKDILVAVITFFAIAVTTTFGATAFGIQTPNASANVVSDTNSSEGA